MSPPTIEDFPVEESDPPFKRSGTVIVRIERFAEFIKKAKNVCEGDWYIISGLGWRLCVKMSENKRRITLSLYCSGDIYDKAWDCSALLKLYAESPGKPFFGRVILRPERQHLFYADSTEFTVDVDTEWLVEKLNDGTNKGDDVLEFAVFISAEKPRALESLLLTETVLVNNQSINVNKHLLAAHSDYFKTLFFGADGTEKHPLIEIDEVAEPVCNFKRLLSIVNGDKYTTLNDDCIEAVLTLANRFTLDTVENKCVKYLQNESKLSALTKFRIADLDTSA